MSPGLFSLSTSKKVTELSFGFLCYSWEKKGEGQFLSIGRKSIFFPLATFRIFSLTLALYQFTVMCVGSVCSFAVFEVPSSMVQYLTSTLFYSQSMSQDFTSGSLPPSGIFIRYRIDLPTLFHLSQSLSFLISLYPCTVFWKIFFISSSDGTQDFTYARQALYWALLENL